MADLRISELDQVTSISGTDDIPCRQNSSTLKFTPAQMLEYIRSTGFSHSTAITNGTDVSSILFDFNPSTNGNITSNYTTYRGLKLDTEYSDGDNAELLSIDGLHSAVTIKNGAGPLHLATSSLSSIIQEYGTNPSVRLIGASSKVECYGSNSSLICGEYIGVYSLGEDESTITINKINGIYCDSIANNYGSNALINVTDCIGIEINYGNWADNFSNCTINTTNNYGILLDCGNYQDGVGDANITNNYGIYLNNSIWGSESNGTITNHYGIYLESFSIATNEWGIYSSGSAAKNYFNGPVTVGTTSASAKIHAVAATEQLRLGYDASNYASFTVSSAGVLNLTTSANKIALGASRTPASATDTGTAGEVCWDANYFYVCVATNTWRRAALSSW